MISASLFSADGQTVAGIVFDDVEYQHGDLQHAVKILCGNAALGGGIAVVEHVAVAHLAVNAADEFVIQRGKGVDFRLHVIEDDAACFRLGALDAVFAAAGFDGVGDQLGRDVLGGIGALVVVKGKMNVQLAAGLFKADHIGDLAHETPVQRAFHMIKLLHKG